MQRLLFCLLWMFSLFISTSYAVEPNHKYILATANTGGTFYPVGMGIANLLSLKEGMPFSAISSNGSFDNIRMLDTKKVDFAMIQGLAGMMAWEGTHMYHNKPHKNLRSVSLLWNNVEHFLVTKDIATTGNIKDLKNLYGQNFSIAENDSGSKASAEIIMDTLGIEYSKMNLYYLGYNQSAVALQQGKIKGMNTPAGAPVVAVGSVFSAMGSLKVSLLEFSDEDLKKIQKQYPIWKRYIIKANTYPRQTKEIQTIAQPNYLVTDVDTPEEVAYRLTKTMYQNLAFLNSVNQGTMSLSLQHALDELVIPLHKGALRYYKERGVSIPQHLIYTNP
ncbi:MULTISPECIES: TAXI family TRAP transporter solute-binding subunit [unclassified Sulfurospirillum]|uniref:TAXI family TRAP transporter solute-binding subunit n=1 Tax=unclassified Sulfurospirillum TaxID=2618290 RepID=UPI000B3140D0|nr:MULTISPECIES: TAXI family TRAP transporter solute-binding subunit [unclassified Sulfurospirillum]